jgi:maltose/moltooligosaccharide transporter
MNMRQRIAYLGGSFSVGVFSAFNNYTMSLWLTSFTTSYVLISMLGNSKSLEGSVVSPLAGYASDRTWAGWLGRRRPFILVGGLLSAALLAVTPLIARMPMPADLAGLPENIVRLIPIVGVIFLFTLTFNMGDDLHKALRADLADGAELNLLSSLATVVDIAAQVGILVLGFLLWSNEIPDWAFAVAGSLIAIGVLATTFGVKEPPPDVWESRNGPVPAAVEDKLGARGLLSVYRGALMFTLVTFFYWSGVNAVLPLVSIFVRDILNTSVGEAQLLPALLLLSTTLMAIPVAKLATKFGKRTVLAVGYVIMSLAAVAGLLITTKEQGALLFLAAGIGNAAAVVLAIPMMAELVPKRHMGAATGVLAAAGSIAAPLASLVAGALSESYGPRVIFAVMAVMVALGLVFLFGVKRPDELTELGAPEAAVPGA